MKQRLITGVIAAALLIALIYRGSEWMIALVVLAFAGMAYYEYDRLFFRDPDWFRVIRVVLFSSASLLALTRSMALWSVTLWLVFIIHSAWHVTRANVSADIESSVRQLRVEFFGYLYCTALFGFLLPILRINYFGRDFLLLLFLVVSFGDTAAYFCGRWFGKHPLAAKISPKKTIEGAIGGTLASVAIAAWWLYFVYNGSRSAEFTTAILAFGFLGSLLAQYGDLLESMLKRSQAVKDSGGLLPGHGGILDRTDGLALAAPAFYFYLRFVLARLQ
jgi:phosphatidate cytidylyltransferase